MIKIPWAKLTKIRHALLFAERCLVKFGHKYEASQVREDIDDLDEFIDKHEDENG